MLQDQGTFALKEERFSQAEPSDNLGLLILYITSTPFSTPRGHLYSRKLLEAPFWQKHKKDLGSFFLGSSTAFLPISCDIGGTISSQCSPVLSCSSTIMQNFVILASFLAPFPLSYLQPSLLLPGTCGLPLLLAGLFSPATSIHALGGHCSCSSKLLCLFKLPLVRCFWFSKVPPH